MSSANGVNAVLMIISPVNMKDLLLFLQDLEAQLNAQVIIEDVAFTSRKATQGASLFTRNINKRCHRIAKTFAESLLDKRKCSKKEVKVPCNITHITFDIM